MEHQIGAYRIERQLGKGGFGVVYAAVDTRLGRLAAVKQLLPALSSQRDLLERFFREARAAASIDHPGIVEIYDVGWHTDGSAYFAMKLLDGDSLAKRLRARGMLAVGVACKIARQVASAVAAAHARGIIHRDLKPDNIMLVADPDVGERAVVLDFGIAKLTGDAGFSLAEPGADTSPHTVTGALLGTPLYMSPEQIRGARDVDHRTDIYALGCILFEMLAGRPPFRGSMGEIVGMHQFVVAPPLGEFRADLPDDLVAEIARALAKDPAARHASLDELAAALEPFLSIVAAPPAETRQSLAVAPTADRPGPSSNETQASLAVAPTAVPAPVSAAPSPPRRRAWPYVAAGSAVVVGILVAATRSPSTTAVPPVDAARVIAADATIDAAAMPDDVDGLRARCREAEAAHRWAELLDCAGKLRHRGTPRDVIQVDAWSDLVVRERNADAQLVELQNGLAKGKLGLAMRALNRIPIETYPRKDAERLFATGEATIVTNALLELRPLTADCAAYGKELDKRRGEYQQGYAFWLAVVMRLPCRSSAPIIETAADCDPDRHAEGNALALRGAYREAFATYRRIVEDCKVDIPEVHAKLVALACRLGDAGVAKRYFGKQPAVAQIVVGRLCREYGVTPDR